MERSDPILNNLTSLYRILGTAGAGVGVMTFGHYSIVKAAHSAWPNIAFGVDEKHFGPDVIRSIAHEAIASQLRPTVILPYNQAWVDMLKTEGFLPVDQWLGMSLHLPATGIAGSEAAGEKDKVIRTVDTAADIHSWTQMAADILFPKQALDVAIFEFLRTGGAELIEMRIDGEPVATAMIYFDGTGMPGIYMVGIKQEHRGKGLGKKIMHFCLKRIMQRGGNQCCLQSTRMGLNLYRSLGFQGTNRYLIFCKIK